jgi:hypothetical protein
MLFVTSVSSSFMIRNYTKCSGSYVMMASIKRSLQKRILLVIRTMKMREISYWNCTKII